MAKRWSRTSFSERVDSGLFKVGLDRKLGAGSLRNASGRRQENLSTPSLVALTLAVLTLGLFRRVTSAPNVLPCA